jgi:hypothetical protein
MMKYATVGVAAIQYAVLLLMTKSIARYRRDARCNLAIVDDDEGAGELVNSDPVVPTVGAN